MDDEKLIKFKRGGERDSQREIDRVETTERTSCLPKQKTFLFIFL